MLLNRKQFFHLAGLAVAAASSCRSSRTGESEWENVRHEFELSPDYVHLACLLVASHPRAVREAIDRHRSELNINPAHYVQQNNQALENEVRKAAAQYLGAKPEEIALTDSTTMGLGTIYNGLKVKKGQELLTTDQDYYSTHASLQLKSWQTGVPMRKIKLYQKVESVTEDEIVDNVRKAISPNTRLLALTWVHSSTGLKIPIQRISEAVQEENARRGRGADRLLLGLDGVHALGVEDFSVHGLGCDFFIAGTHKWLFGPRGTGIIWAHPRAHAEVIATIPTFSKTESWGGWMTPGGFHSFEHRWALIEAFRFHQQIGKSRVTGRIHELGLFLKQGLRSLNRVKLHTPVSDDLSAGIVCFDIDGLTPAEVVSRLGQQKIIASETPYEPSHARMTPGLINSRKDLERALHAVRAIAES